MDLGVTDFRLTGVINYKPIRKLEFTLLGGIQNTSTRQ